jgi:hypothetical protein
MKSRESTPMVVEDEHHLAGNSSQQNTSTLGFPQRYPNHVLEASPTPSDSTSSSEEARNLTQMLADTVATYCSDSDADYIPDADTTVDEFSNRVDSSSGEEDDDDSFTEIDADNINVPDAPLIESSSPRSLDRYNSDEYECDEITEDQAEIIVEQARAFGMLML